MGELENTETIQLKSGSYNLTRTRDGAGERGTVLTSLIEPEGAMFHHEMIAEDTNGLLKKGNWHQVSSPHNYFRCTPITRFLEIEKDDQGEVIRVLFKTLNSEYEVRVF